MYSNHSLEAISIGDFINFLSPKIERGDIIESIETVKEDIGQSTYPALNDLVENKLFTGPDPFKSAIMKKFNTNYRLAIKPTPKENFIAHAHRIFNGIMNNFDAMVDNIDKHFDGKVFSKTGLTYPKATMLRLINIMQFASRYTRRIMLFTYAEEVSKVYNETPNTKPFTPGEINWFKLHERNYFAVMNILSHPMEEILLKINSMPDIAYDPESEATTQLIKGDSSFDPMRMGFLPVLGPVMMFFGTRWVQWQAENLEALREEKELLDLQLAQLKYSIGGQKDASLEKLIEVKQERVKNLNYKIAKIERNWGIE